jgi:hypothetical protein
MQRSAARARADYGKALSKLCLTTTRKLLLQSHNRQPPPPPPPATMKTTTTLHTAQAMKRAGFLAAASAATPQSCWIS